MVYVHSYAGAMGLTSAKGIALTVSLFGLLAFLLGVIAENKKPPYGTPIKGKDVVICKFPSDPTIAMGSLSIVALVLAAFIGHVAIFYPYKGKSVPRGALFQSTSLSVFFVIAELVSALAFAMLLWATITEGRHRTSNIHHDMDTLCPTAKTGLFGGAAFLALDAALFWLVCQMLALNARADYLDEDEDEDDKGEYGQVYATDADGTKV
uniref:Uncharacterized protein n=1 Tax=Aegilops tauschii subsp. strangulata TaxID=200361 RepID=A0A452XRT5_AEGTS